VDLALVVLLLDQLLGGEGGGGRGHDHATVARLNHHHRHHHHHPKLPHPAPATVTRSSSSLALASNPKLLLPSADHPHICRSESTPGTSTVASTLAVIWMS